MIFLDIIIDIPRILFVKCKMYIIYRGVASNFPWGCCGDAVGMQELLVGLQLASTLESYPL